MALPTGRTFCGKHDASKTLDRAFFAEVPSDYPFGSISEGSEGSKSSVEEITCTRPSRRPGQTRGHVNLSIFPLWDIRLLPKVTTVYYSMAY
jgi:hypothetical protein